VSSVHLRVRSRRPPFTKQNFIASLDTDRRRRVIAMARKRIADTNSTPVPSSSPMTVSRRRSTLRELQATTAADGDIMTPKIIDARPSLEKAEMYGIDDPRPASSRMMALAGRIFIETIPQWLAVGAMLGLIFGGCCSNVS
jgi:UDP-xylose/UDP-N-acetylglucosamine transporter B4